MRRTHHLNIAREKAFRYTQPHDRQALVVLLFPLGLLQLKLLS
jgi:hypothetical protein